MNYEVGGDEAVKKRCENTGPSKPLEWLYECASTFSNEKIVKKPATRQHEDGNKCLVDTIQ